MLLASVEQKKYSLTDFLGIELSNEIDSLCHEFESKGSRRKIFSNSESHRSSNSSHFDLTQRLYLEDIHQLLPERAPGLQITKAAIGYVNNDCMIVAPFPITEETCAGHMPGFPFLPLAEAGRVLAQVGAILDGYYAKTVDHKSGLITPLVYKVGEVLSGSQGYLTPGNTVCIVAKIKKLKGPLYSVQAHGFLDQKHIFSMPKIQYFISEDPQLWGI